MVEWRKVPGLLAEVTRNGRVRAVKARRVGRLIKWEVREVKPTVGGTTPSPRFNALVDGAFFSVGRSRRKHCITVARAMSLAFDGPIASGNFVVRCGDGLKIEACCRFTSRSAALTAINVAVGKKQYGQSIVNLVMDARSENPPVSYGRLSKRLEISTSKLFKIVNFWTYAPEREVWAKSRNGRRL